MDNMIRVLYSEGHGEIPLDQTPFKDYMQRVGVEISTTKSSKFTYEELKNFDILMIHSADRPFGPDSKTGREEVGAIQTYLKEGKRLIVSLSRHGDSYADTNMNYLLKILDAGVYFNSHWVIEGEVKFKEHQITEGLESQIPLFRQEGTKQIPIACTTLRPEKTEGLEVLIETGPAKVDNRSCEFNEAKWKNIFKHPETIQIPSQPVAAIKYLKEGTLALFGCDYLLTDHPVILERTINYIVGESVQHEEIKASKIPSVPSAVATSPAPVSKLEEIGRKVLQKALESGKKIEELGGWQLRGIAPEITQSNVDGIKKYLMEKVTIKLSDLSYEELKNLDSKAVRALEWGYGEVPDLASLVISHFMSIDDAKNTISYIDAIKKVSNEDISQIGLTETDERDLDRDTGKYLRYKKEHTDVDCIQIAHGLKIGPLKTRLIELYFEAEKSRPYVADIKDAQDRKNIENLAKILTLRKKPKVTFLDVLTYTQLGPFEAKKALMTYDLMKTRLEPTPVEEPLMDRLAVKLCKEEDIEGLMQAEKLTIVDVVKAINYMKKQRSKKITSEDVEVADATKKEGEKEGPKINDILFNKTSEYISRFEKIPTPEELISYDKSLDSYGYRIVAETFSMARNDPNINQDFRDMIISLLPNYEKTLKQESKTLNDKIEEILKPVPIFYRDNCIVDLISELKKSGKK
jgi:hypothetical protein